MSSPEAAYERGWDVCVRCGTRRPLRELEHEVDGNVCRDHDFCQRARTEAPINAPGGSVPKNGKNRNGH